MDRTGEFERLLLDSVKSIGDQQTVELKTNKVDLSKRQPLTKEAYLIRETLFEVDELLRKNLKAYLRLTNIHERTSNEEWIDQQRTELDQQCSQFLQSSLRRITTFRQQIHALPAINNQPTLREHWESVALSLEGQLKQLSERQRDQQLIRRQQQQAGATAVLLSASQELSPVERESILRRRRISFDAIGQLNSEQLNTFYTSPVGDEDQPSLIPHDERMMLEQENDQLLEELLGLETEVKQAEKTLMEISQLQSTLESHVVAQSEEISRLHDESIRTTETVRSGNQQLKKVTQAGVEFRNFMIFFMLILSFTLLFLHWYD